MRAAPHPPVLHHPEAIWRRPHPSDEKLRTSAEVLPYRPDWYARHPADRSIGFRFPACAVAALVRNYEALSRDFEPALKGSGAAVYHLQGWASSQQVPLKQPPRFYRDILVRDGYWGLRHARRTQDPTLSAEIEAWADGHRREFASAAATFLVRHPRETVRPYVELLQTHPFYLYISLPKLHPRGLTVGKEAASQAKWAFHFGTSVFTQRDHDYGSIVLRDPAWAVQYLQARTNGKPTPAEVREHTLRLQACASGHPLLERSIVALEPSALVPAPLADGRDVETRTLGALGRSKNHQVWRPSSEQIASAEFKRVVGMPQYTDFGFPRGTVVDSDDAQALTEIKSGTTPLAPTYQLKLQAFRAVAEARRLQIYTSRPIEPSLQGLLGPLGVEIDPLPNEP